MRNVTLAATQMKCSQNEEENILKAESNVREAASKGANIILLQELFSNIYFCQEMDYKSFRFARAAEKNPLIDRMSKLAKALEVVIPVSFFEKCNEAYYNTVAVIDADGTVLGYYRKSHIPDDPGYYEKFYFTPGDTGFRVWDTKYAKIGVGICWDQWFPEAARCMALAGAEILLYPTAIGTEPASIDDVKDKDMITDRWTKSMVGHSIDNMVPIVASNRTGIEEVGETAIRFFGSSFITDAKGDIIALAGTDEECLILAKVDLDDYPKTRVLRFRDRRTDLYDSLLSKDGKTIV